MRRIPSFLFSSVANLLKWLDIIAYIVQLLQLLAKKTQPAPIEEPTEV